MSNDRPSLRPTVFRPNRPIFRAVLGRIVLSAPQPIPAPPVSAALPIVALRTGEPLGGPSVRGRQSGSWARPENLVA